MSVILDEFDDLKLMNPQKIPDVPIIVETISRPYFPMHRCNYLYVECDEPRSGWQFTLGQQSMPFLMLGLVGIIQAPLGAPRFEQYGHLSQLFDLVEEQWGMTVNFADVWLPEFLFRPSAKVGEVYRLGLDMFKTAQFFRDGRLSKALFLAQAERLGETLEFSEAETKVFSAWSQECMLSALHQPDKDPRLRLSDSDTDADEG